MQQSTPFFSPLEGAEKNKITAVFFLLLLLRILWLAILGKIINVQAGPTVSMQQILVALLHESTFQNNFRRKSKHILLFISRLTSLLDNFV